MVSQKEREKKKVFVSYKDDNDENVSGYFELVEETKEFIKIKSGINIITLPYHRVKKMKEIVK
ncbi:hypothetical protein LCGC14_2190720 [marine sediment metagenome]|uniref:Uncharacterized protein n=1 Tax=marine sediment metagenome TaxID=412755 RepID=A0A0F8VC97_9ZZZZ